MNADKNIRLERVARTNEELDYLLRNHVESKIEYTEKELSRVSEGLINFFRAEVGNHIVDF
tara:strand:- start:422 stop:604 length:183 start_codon:yes stop_codon:yes gene_type:complete